MCGILTKVFDWSREQLYSPVQLPERTRAMERDERVSTGSDDPFEREVGRVFQETLGLIHIALVTHYGLEETEASELEKDLYLWFLRFCARPGNSSPLESRPFLLVACCQFAREYQK